LSPALTYASHSTKCYLAKGKIPDKLAYQHFFQYWQLELLKTDAINRPRLSTSTSADSILIPELDREAKTVFFLQVQDKNVIEFSVKEALAEAEKAFKIVKALRENG